MISVITEHLNLMATKTRVAGHGHLGGRAGDIIEAIDRAIEDTGAQLRTAIDTLPTVPRRLAGSALLDIEAHTMTGVHFDAVLEGAALLGADIDVDDHVARLRGERESNSVDLNRSLAVLMKALAGVRVDAGDEYVGGERRCTECGTIAPGHSTVHERHHAGGGGTNRPCSRGTAASE